MRIANLWALIGDTARAVHWLERAYTERNPGLVHARREPAFENLRSHPRIARILREMSFRAGEPGAGSDEIEIALDPLTA